MPKGYKGEKRAANLTNEVTQAIERMAAKADEQAFQAILNRVPDAPIPPSDALPE